MKRVVIESPYSGDIERNMKYARDCLADSLRRGEAPFASHLLYTQPGVLRDEIEHERALGMEASFTWTRAAALVAVYTDYGITVGMAKGIEFAKSYNIPIVYRSLDVCK